MSAADLTPPQQAAVEHVDGPLLVLAGPGSGKTRVITRRIARLIEHGVRPRNILAITFTNKAADEMQRRVEALTPGGGVWVSTFHRFCARLLRSHAPSVGLQPNYTILDSRDQKQALRRVISDLGLDPVHYSPEKVGYRISNAKNDLIDAESYVARYNESIADHLQAVVARVYPAYQRWLLDSNAVDFDDLLLHTATLLTENPELRETLDERYRYILVNEYQDTNLSQYRIVAALSQKHANLCVTGDPDQSIYGWRGARIENILKFEREFPQAQVVRLEANFRSTGAILRSADRLIAHNRQRKAKSLITDNVEGEPVQLLHYTDETAEAEGIAGRIQELVTAGDRNYSDFAVFYRVNALSRQLELALLRHRVPFQVAAGVAFYDRTEIKDLLCYLRLVYNPADRAAFLRVVNTPLRGLGKTSQQRLVTWAQQQRLNFIEAAARAGEVPKLSKRAIKSFQSFAGLISDLSLADAGSVQNLLMTIIEKTSYTKPWEGSGSEQDQDRLANVQELVTAAGQFDEFMADETSLEGFLEQTALVNETDSLDTSRGQVTLMTLHAAKGLEFPVVFVLAVEEGLIPHERATRDGSRQELEEERRLLFVGMTRAEERLFLTQTTTRSLRGRSVYSIPSPFLSELECEVVEEAVTETSAPHWVRNSLPSPPGGGGAGGEGGAPINFDRKPLLTTAADLLNGDKRQADLPQGFGRGMQVRHPRYGLGTVIDVGGFGNRRTVTVSFADGERTETFVASQSPLQPVG